MIKVTIFQVTVKMLPPKSDDEGVVDDRDRRRNPDAAAGDGDRGLPSDCGGGPTTRCSRSRSLPALTSHSSRNSSTLWPFFGLREVLFTFLESCSWGGPWRIGARNLRTKMINLLANIVLR